MSGPHVITGAIPGSLVWGWWRKNRILKTCWTPAGGAQLVLRYLRGSDPGPVVQKMAGIGSWYQ